MVTPRSADVACIASWVQEADNAFEIGRPAIKAQMIERGYVAEGYDPDVVDMCAPVRALPVPQPGLIPG